MKNSMTFDVEIVLRDHNEATTDRLRHDVNEAPRWTERDVEMVLKSMLLAINRARNPLTADTFVALRGFSWIVEPTEGGVVIAIEIPMGAAVAGPFDIPHSRLERMISRLVAAAAPRPPVVH